MKAASMSVNHLEGDSVFYTRLLDYVEECSLILFKYIKLRSNVYVIYTNEGIFLLKGFSSKEKLELQKAFTAYLYEQGFYETYKFREDHKCFSYRGLTYTLIEYLPSRSKKFSYKKETDRVEGLKLLSKFHEAGKGFKSPTGKALPKLRQKDKWEERIKVFEQFIPSVQTFVSDSIISSFMEWGRWSLEGLGKYNEFLNKEENTVLHGDVAHHNFLRKKNGALSIIDFDLISSGPPILDILQYANRILPYLHDFEAIWDYHGITKYKTNPAFLYALAFPADIFREWNRIFRENLVNNQVYVHSIWKLTVEQYSERMKFYSSLSKMVGG
ncbi:phosphotransferase [Peribacillus alkalitolerans]|uniref:phosphotransferase n=1 Tax=Peribacillus alkalitolerans TaxID=1550385 RepID=UPI0013D66FA7|nr:phosphotransferase [Peribacillus alkalitolerans]